jgi:hypothetical protein
MYTENYTEIKTNLLNTSSLSDKYSIANESLDLEDYEFLSRLENNQEPIKTDSYQTHTNESENNISTQASSTEVITTTINLQTFPKPPSFPKVPVVPKILNIPGIPLTPLLKTMPLISLPQSLTSRSNRLLIKKSFAV